jgi:hypothetical protein
VITMLNRTIRELFEYGKVLPVFVTEHDAIKAYWRSGGVAPLIL